MSRATPQLTVFGAGPWGSSLAAWLAARGYRTAPWSRNTSKVEALQAGQPGCLGQGSPPPELTATTDMEFAAAADLLFLAIPPRYVAGLVGRLAPFLRPEQRIVHGAKGLCEDGRSVSQVVLEGCCVLRVGVLAGPVEPADLWRGSACAAVIASPLDSLVQELRSLLGNPQLRLYGSLDLAGVEAGGAMWAPVAMAVGMIGGGGMPAALGPVLLTRALVEGGRLATARGGQAQTLAGLAGIGDWMRALLEDGDPLVAAGRALAERPGNCPDKEGAQRVSTLVKLAEQYGIEMPISRAVLDVIDGRSVADALAGLMSLPSGYEVD